MSIYIDPESLRGGSTAADHAAQRLKAVASWGAPSPTGISGRTQAQIQRAQSLSRHAGNAGSDQAVYLRTTAMLAINIDATRCSSKLSIDPIGLAPLSDPFGREKRMNPVSAASLKYYRHHIGVLVGTGGGVVDAFHSIRNLGKDVLSGKVKPTAGGIARQISMTPQERLGRFLYALGKDAVGNVKGRASKNQGAQAVGRGLFEAAGLASIAGKAGTVAKGANVAGGATRRAATLRAANRIGVIDVRTLGVKGYERAVARRAREARIADNSARARVQSLNAHPPSATASAGTRASHETALAVARAERIATEIEKKAALASEKSAPSRIAAAELAGEAGLKAHGGMDQKQEAKSKGSGGVPQVCQ